MIHLRAVKLSNVSISYDKIWRDTIRCWNVKRVLKADGYPASSTARRPYQEIKIKETKLKMMTRNSGLSAIKFELSVDWILL